VERTPVDVVLPAGPSRGRPRVKRRSRPAVASEFPPQFLLDKITAGKSVRDYRRNQGVFSQGDPADAVFYIQNGKVKLTVVSARGKEAVIGILGRGSFFGEGCLAGQLLRMSTATAMPSATLVRVDKKTMVALLHRDREFAEVFIAYLLSRNARIEEDLVDQLFNSSEKRLARILLLLAHFGKASDVETAIPKMTQETLASMVGTTRSRVSYFLNRFRKMGFIDYDGAALKVRRGLLTVVLYD
jgi:CRP/FNR family cyclic AMP-dependent transcriptional regulator